MSTLLHKRILGDLLTDSLDRPLIVTATHFDTLSTQSRALLTTTEDIVTTLYAPQNLEHLKAELTLFSDVARKLQPSILVFFPVEPLEEKFGAMSLRGGKDSRRWFDTCFEQIHKTIQTFDVTLGLELNSKP